LHPSEIKQEIEKLTGHKLVLSEWIRVWNILKDGLSNMFLAHGAAIVEEIASLTHHPGKPKPPQQLLDHIESIAARVAGMPGKGDRAATIAQSVRDLFSERNSAAFTWLGELSSVYIDMCSLVIPSNEPEPLSSTKVEPLGPAGVVGTTRRAPVAPLGTRVKARSGGEPGVVA